VQQTNKYWLKTKQKYNRKYKQEHAQRHDLCETLYRIYDEMLLIGKTLETSWHDNEVQEHQTVLS
jgi:hypothetical protein